MMSLEEYGAKTENKAQVLEHSQRVEIRAARMKQIKNDRHRKYVVGELVTKYFPEIMNPELGAAADTIIPFEQLEAMLSKLAADKKLIEQLKKQASSEVLSDVKHMCEITIN